MSMNGQPECAECHQPLDPGQDVGPGVEQVAHLGMLGDHHLRRSRDQAGRLLESGEQIDLLEGDVALELAVQGRDLALEPLPIRCRRGFQGQGEELVAMPVVLQEDIRESGHGACSALLGRQIVRGARPAGLDVS